MIIWDKCYRVGFTRAWFGTGEGAALPADPRGGSRGHSGIPSKALCWLHVGGCLKCLRSGVIHPISCVISPLLPDTPTPTLSSSVSEVQQPLEVALGTFFFWREFCPAGKHTFSGSLLPRTSQRGLDVGTEEPGTVPDMECPSPGAEANQAKGQWGF